MKSTNILQKYDALIREIEELRPISADQEKRIMSRLRLEWNYHSNAIEGNSLTYGETKAFLLHGVTAKGKPFKDYLDIKGHDHVLDLLADIVRNKDELTEALIRELHKLLMVEPYVERVSGGDGVIVSRRVEIGKYKTAPNHVMTATGKEFYFSSPEATPAKMNELIQWFRAEKENRTIHPLVFAASFHHRFVSIHPFDDGNGRMARILMNFILMQSGYLPIVIRSDKRNEYFLALSHADEGDLSLLVDFVAESGIESAELFLKAAKGEFGDDLSDFDKTLKLFAQSLQRADEELPELSVVIKNEVMANFVAPLFRLVAIRFEHIESLFASSELKFNWVDKLGAPKFAEGRGLEDKIHSLCANSRDVVIKQASMFYSAKAFVKNPAKDFLCYIAVYFHPQRVLVTLNLTGNGVVELLSGNYGSPPDENDAKKIAENILSEMVASLKKLP